MKTDIFVFVCVCVRERERRVLMPILHAGVFALSRFGARGMHVAVATTVGSTKLVPVGRERALSAVVYSGSRYETLSVELAVILRLMYLPFRFITCLVFSAGTPASASSIGEHQHVSRTPTACLVPWH